MKSREPQLSVIVPARNERENIMPMLGALRAALHGIIAEIIVVDDSDDETPAIVSQAAAGSTEEFRVVLCHRPAGPEREGGLATAVSCGMAQAHAKYLAVMDADLQHPPERLRVLFEEAVATNADVVMATRYRGGGKSSGLEGFSRHLFSVGLKYVAKIVFPDQLLRVSDPLGGFFLVRRSIVDGVTLRPIGYKISLELLIRCHWARLVEVPYEFQPRAGGQSKSDFKQGMLVLRHMGRLVREVPGAARFWKFCLVGASGVAVNLGVFHLLLNMLHLTLWPAWIAAIELSILSNFVLNSLLTWKDVAASRGRDWAARTATYHAAVAPNILLNLLVFTVLAHSSVGTLVIDQAIGVLAATLLSYWLARRMVFIPRQEWSSPFPARQGAITLSGTASEDRPMPEPTGSPPAVQDIPGGLVGDRI